MAGIITLLSFLELRPQQDHYGVGGPTGRDMKDILAVVLIGPLGGFAAAGVFAWQARLVLPTKWLLVVVGYLILQTAFARVYRNRLKRRSDLPMATRPRTREVVRVVILGSFTGLAILGAEATFLDVLPTNVRVLVVVGFGLTVAAATTLAARRLLPTSG